MTKKFIEENLLTVQKKLNSRALMRLKIKESHETLYKIYHNVEQPVCEVCGNPKKFVGFPKGYSEGCTQSCPTTRDRRKKTCIEKYGVDTIINRPDVQAKGLKKAASKECREKVRQTVQERYGVDNVSQLEEIKLQKEETCLKNHGVRHINQSGKYNFGYNYKDYILPSGKIIKIQGYENYLLDELLKEYDESDILTERKSMPELWYIGTDGKEHRYFPDVYVPKTNTIYEVKSEYTLNDNRKRNELKFQSVRDAGYNFILKVY